MSQDQGSAGASGAGGAATSTTTTTAAPQSNVQPSSAPEWTGGLNDEMKGYVQNKGFKGVTDVLESYRNYEKLQGVPQDRLLKLPENLDSDEGRSIFEKLGRPKEATGYSIDIPKEHGDEKLASALREIGFKNNFTQKQMEGLVGWWNGRQAETLKNNTAAQEAAKVQSEANLKRDWGTAYEQNKETVTRAAINLELSDKELHSLGASLGADKSMKLLLRLGQATGEHTFVGGGPGGGSHTSAEQAKSEIARLQGDSGFISRIRAGDTEAKKLWNDLHKSAFPGEMGL